MSRKYKNFYKNSFLENFLKIKKEKMTKFDKKKPQKRAS